MVYSLRFTLETSNSGELQEGILELIKDGATINQIRARSSLGNKQYSGAWNVKGGLIPPGEWEVATDPINMNSVPGVASGKKSIPSLFYQIFPEIKKMANGVIRGDFGLHWDGRSPGSLGCIVFFTEIGWLRVRQFMYEANKAGLDRIPLEVIYT